MRACVFCKTRYQKDSGITFHKFPTGPLKQLWINNMRFENWSPQVNDLLCSKHFTEDSFIRHVARTTLKSGSVPTLFSDAENKSSAQVTQLDSDGMATATTSLSVEKVGMKRNISSISVDQSNVDVDEPDMLEIVENIKLDHRYGETPSASKLISHIRENIKHDHRYGNTPGSSIKALQSNPRLSHKAVPSQFSWNQQSEEKLIKEIVDKEVERALQGEKSEPATLSTKETNEFGDDCESTMNTVGANASNAPQTAAKKYGNCRCCMSFGQHIKLEKDHNEILLKLSIFLQEDSRLPDRICQECVSHLQSFSEFRTKVIATQKTLVGTVTGAVKLEPQIEVEVGGQTTAPDPLALTDVDIKEEKLDDDSDSSDDANTETTFDHNEDMEDQDRKDIVFEDGPLPTIGDDTPQETSKPVEMNVLRVTSSVQPQLNKILVQQNPPLIAQKAPMSTGLRMTTSDLAARLGLVAGASTSSVPGKITLTPPSLQLGNLQPNVNIVRLPPAVQRTVTRLPSSTQILRPLGPSPSNKNVRLFVDSTDPNKIIKLGVKSEPEASTSKTTGKLTVESIASETDEDSNAGELDETPESKKRKSPKDTEEAPIKPKRRRKRATSQFINIGSTSLEPNLKNLLRADIIQILQNSTIIPFLPYNHCNSFKCLYCKVKENKFPALKLHFMKEHKTKIADSDVYKILRNLFFERNCLIHADITNLKCKICDKPFVDVSVLVDHLKCEHDKVFYHANVKYKNEYNGPPYGVLCFRLEKEPFECVVCSKQFEQTHLNSHMTEHYSTCQCEYCERKFISYSVMFSHKQMHSKEARFKCSECGKLFTFLKERKSHKYHIIENEYGIIRKLMKCCYCSKQFTTNNQKHMHIEKEHSKKHVHLEKEHSKKNQQLKCRVCDKTFVSDYVLRRHSATVHNLIWPMKPKNRFMCDKCGFTTYNKYFLSKHINSHYGIFKNYECDLCQKILKTRRSIELHLRGHYNDKRFACSLCDAAFIQKPCLNIHMKSKHPDSGIVVNKRKKKS